jgi:hypothetical protein
MKKVQYIIPQLDRDHLYIEKQGAPKSRHNLTLFKSHGTKSVLEAYHASLQHYGNMNSRSDTTNAKVLLGTTRYNAERREVLRINMMENQKS